MSLPRDLLAQANSWQPRNDAERAFTDWDTVRNSIQADTFILGLLSFDQMRG